MGWALEVTLSYELGGRVASDQREEHGSPHLIVEILQHRLDHLHGEWRWTMPDPDLEYEGEVVQWEWQHAPCCGRKRRWSGDTAGRPCDHVVRLTQEQAARSVVGEHVEVYCSWCAFDITKGRVLCESTP